MTSTTATIPEALAIALAHHQAGQLQAAEQIYRQILVVQPNHVDAMHLLGVVAHQGGKHDVAVEYIGRAIRLKGNEAAFHNNLGSALRHQGRLQEAEASYRRALELNPNFFEAHNNLGIALVLEQRPEEAIASWRQALRLKPDYAEAHYNLGNALMEQGELREAVDCYRRALATKPDYPDAWSNLGDVLRQQGNLQEAVDAWRRLVQLQPDRAEGYNNLGNALQEQGQLDEAIACHRRALELKPDFVEAHTNLGADLQAQGKLDEAIDCYRRALSLEPDRAVAHYNLGNALADQGAFDDAIRHYRRALELDPLYAEAYTNLGNALKEQGRFDEAISCYRRALHVKPDHAAAHSNLLYTMQYRGDATLSGLAAAHAEYDRQHAASLRDQHRAPANVPDPDRRLRVGFVSPDLGRHPVGYFLIRILENVDRDEWDTVCYSERPNKDDVTARFQAAATVWRDIGGLSHETLSALIVADEIDVLFDLAGHSAKGRLLVFARKPCPIQITWLGYEGTTGLESIDYILADRYTIPPAHEPFYRESVLRLPDGYVCYDPPSVSPDVSSLPALKNGSIRFGSFNNQAKITPRVVEIWAKILHQVPRSRLMLMYRGLRDDSIRARYADLFANLGIGPARLELAPACSYVDYLAAYGKMDIALDPFPFGGGITTCDALWMGVPVVTCPGETFASRHGLSHLSNVGLTETIARDFDDYVNLAESLANDLPRLASLRASLRERMAGSPLCDGKRFAVNLMNIVRGVWRVWCHDRPARHS